jgi:hypothetical protein
VPSRRSEPTACGVGETEGGGRPERQARVDRAQHSAQCRAQHEAKAERGTHQSERAGALFCGRDVGDVGICGREARRRDAGYDAAAEQPNQRRGERHQHVVEAEAQHGDEQHRAAAEAIGHGAQQRREDELHERPGRAEQAVDLGRARRVPAQHALHQLGQHGDDDAERNDIEQHDGEDEGERGLARLGRRCGFLHGAQSAGCGGANKAARSQNRSAAIARGHM